MNDVIQQQPAAEIPPASKLPNLRTMVWSIRREIWENRSVYIAPICAALLILLGFSISAAHLAPYSDKFGSLDPAGQKDLLRHALLPTQAIVMLTTAVVAFFYCLDALFTERRDRSILFWKSLPVSDLETVLSKLAMPVLVIPAVAFVVICCTQLILIISASLILSSHGVSASGIWSNLSLVELWSGLLYGEMIFALWYLPVYGWLFLISAWAQRLPFLWAVLPPVGAMIVESLGFGTSYIAKALGDRIVGGYTHGFQQGFGIVDTSDAMHSSISSVPDPAGSFATPGLWIGLAVAAALIAASVLIRRFREAI